MNVINEKKKRDKNEIFSSRILFKTLFKLISGKVEWGWGLAAFRKELKVMKI